MAAALAPFLPLAAGGALAYYLHGGEQQGLPPTRELTDEDRRRNQELTDLRRNGASAAHWQVQHNKTFLMGGAMKEPLTIDFTGGGWNPNPNIDPLEAVWNMHADLDDFDRQDTFSVFTYNDGEIRMRRRMPVAASLSPEIYNPRNPAQTTEFVAYRAIPHWANEAQMRQAAAMLDPNQSKDKFLRNYHDQEFFTRAPGQSFRYE